MPTTSKRLVPHKSSTGDRVFEYFLFSAFRIVSFVLLRFFSVVIAFTLLLPAMIIVFSLGATPFESIVPTLIKIIVWPVAITGRTSYTQDDLDLLVFGWTALAIVIGFVASKLGVQIHIRFRHKLLAIGCLFLTALLILLLSSAQQEKGTITLVFVMLFVACIFATFFAWVANLGIKEAGKHL